MNQYFKTRKSVRSFSDQVVTESLLNAILNDAMQAPTTGNMQLYSVIISRDEEKKKLLFPTHFNQPTACNAPLLLTFCVDFNRFNKWCIKNSAVPSYDNFQSFITGLLDVTIFAQQFNTIAEMAGLGCCYLGTTTYNAPAIASLLNLPTMTVPVITLAVGYPTEDAKNTPIVERLPLEAIIHHEEYNDYSEVRIDELYKEKDNLPANKKFIEENNKETLAQVFTDIRYAKKNNEYFSKVYYDFIQAQGFQIPE